MCEVRVRTAVNRHAASDGIFLMKAEQTTKQVRSNIFKKTKRHNAVIQFREMDSAVSGTVCAYRDGQCWQWHCERIQRWTVLAVALCTVYTHTHTHTHIYIYIYIYRDHSSTVVKVLCYKSEGRWFDASWCHWNFSLT